MPDMRIQDLRWLSMTTSMTSDCLGRAVKNLRVQQGMTQAEVAARAGLATEQICRLEKGLYEQPTIGTLGKVATALYVSLSELIGMAELEGC